MHNAAALRAAFSDRDWATGEDYVLQDRVRDLRRYGDTLAGQVQGVRADYWVRLSLTPAPLSVCDCGRPRCRHAAALLQAYLAQRLPVVDIGQAVQEFLRAPHAAPLATAALGEDLLAAFALPPSAVQDIWALPEPRRVLALETALAAGPDPVSLLGETLSRNPDGPTAEWLASALGHVPIPTPDWLELYAAAPERFAPVLWENRPEEWRPDDANLALGLLYARAAAGDLGAVERIARLLDQLGARRRALRALADLLPSHPRLARTLLRTAASGEVRWAGRRAESVLERLDEGERRTLEDDLRTFSRQDPPLEARLLLERAARSGGRRDLRAARRKAIAAGVWPRLRQSLPLLLSGRPDGPLREVELWLLDEDFAGAEAAAARSAANHLPERLLGDALRREHPVQALHHYLRAQRIAQATGASDALLDQRIQELRAQTGVAEQVTPRGRRS